MRASASVPSRTGSAGSGGRGLSEKNVIVVEIESAGTIGHRVTRGIIIPRAHGNIGRSSYGRSANWICRGPR